MMKNNLLGVLVVVGMVASIFYAFSTLIVKYEYSCIDGKVFAKEKGSNLWVIRGAECREVNHANQRN